MNERSKGEEGLRIGRGTEEEKMGEEDEKVRRERREWKSIVYNI